VKSVEDILQFITAASTVADEIAVDHGAASQELAGAWCFDVRLSPPSIASGFSAPTEALFFCLEIRFTCPSKDVSKTRNLTIFDPASGRDNYPGGEMVLRSTPLPSGGSEVLIGFFLHCANATNSGWGFIAERRNRKAQETAETLAYVLGASSTGIWLDHDDSWLGPYRG